MNTVIKLVFFSLVSIGILYISRKSLRNTQSHGFYRFFAFESILGLFLINIDQWLNNPFSWNQLISWSLLCISVIPLVFGIRDLRKLGKPAEKREEEPQLLAFERTTALVTTGIYHYIRHPMYSSLLVLTWGLFFKAPGWWGILLTMVSSISLMFTARMDELECIRFFGTGYQEYTKRTKRFIPFLF